MRATISHAAYGDSDDEGEALNGPVYRGKLFSETTGETAKRRNTIRGLCAILLLLLGVAWLVVDGKAETQAFEEASDSGQKSKVPKGACPKFCEARLNQRMKHHGGDFLSNTDLLKQIDTAKNKVVKELKGMYGEFYNAVFLENNKWRQGFIAASGPTSSDRFRRKMQMKVLQMQLALRNENSNLQGCDCNSQRRLEVQELALPDLPQTYSKFIWATGGHSAAAGHGNLYNESYTAYMERSAKPIFEAAGIEFVGKNYAMGGMRSAPELALCSDSIFGRDADVISWDFGMTDTGDNWKQYLYNTRAGLNPGRPAVVGINIHGFDLPNRIKILERNAEEGLAAFYLSEDVINAMEEVIPDQFGKNQDEIDKSPDYVRDFKCQGKIENGDPFCKDHKYNEALCSNRHHKAPWHPGYKVFALFGNLMAFFLVETLEEAIRELGEGYDPNEKLAELLKLEDADYQIFGKQVIEKGTEMYDMKEHSQSLIDTGIDMHMMHHQPAICHTAITPSEIRYKGILTETEAASLEYYDYGISKVAADKGHTDGPMRLVFEEMDRNPPCPVLTKVDFKDFFYANSKDGWNNMVLPNDRELEEYGEPWEPKGVIMICFRLCDWGKCPPGDVREPAIGGDKKLKMKINDVEVTELAIAAECSIAKHKGGMEFKPDKDGKFKFEVLVEENGDHVQYVSMTSIIMF